MALEIYIIENNSRVIKTNKGEVLLLESQLISLKKKNAIGYVSQKSNSFNTGFPATVTEVVRSGLVKKIGLFHRYPANVNKEVRQALKSVGMDEFAMKNIGDLSGGQQQRVFIARALISNPKCINTRRANRWSR